MILFGLAWRLYILYNLLSLRTHELIDNFKLRVIWELVLSFLNIFPLFFSWYFIAIEGLLIFHFYLRVRLIRLADLLLGSIDEVSHYVFRVGTNYVALKIRGNIIFGFLGIKRYRIFVATRDYSYSEATISKVRKYISKFISAKKIEYKDYDGIGMVIFDGKIVFLDPEKQTWKKLTGKFGIIEF